MSEPRIFLNYEQFSTLLDKHSHYTNQTRLKDQEKIPRGFFKETKKVTFKPRNKVDKGGKVG
jgi:hypothetical protein